MPHTTKIKVDKIKVDKSKKVDKSVRTTKKSLSIKPVNKQTQKVVVQIGQNVLKKQTKQRPKTSGGGGSDNGKPPKNLRIPPTPQVARLPYLGATRDAASLASLMGGYIKTSQPMSIDQIDALRGRVNKLESELDRQARASGLGFSRSLNEVQQIPRLEPIPSTTQPIISEYQTMLDDEKKSTPPEIIGSSAARTEYHTVGQTLQSEFKKQPMFQPDSERKYSFGFTPQQVIDFSYLTPIPKAVEEKYRAERKAEKDLKDKTPSFIKSEDKPQILAPTTPSTPLTVADIATTEKKERFRTTFEKLFGSRSDRDNFDAEGQRRMYAAWKDIEGKISETPKSWYLKNKLKYMKVSKK